MKLRGKNKKRYNEIPDDDDDGFEKIEDFGFTTSDELPPMSTGDISHVGQPVILPVPEPMGSMPEAIKPLDPSQIYPGPSQQAYIPQQQNYEPEQVYPADQLYNQEGYAYVQEPAGEQYAENSASYTEDYPSEESPEYYAQPATTQASGLMQYPDDTHFTEEQERAIQMVAGGGTIGGTAQGEDESLSFGENKGFDHLSPPKKSAGKIILITFLIILATGIIGTGGWYYWWTQYATFPYELQTVVVLDGQAINPNEFLPVSEIERGVRAVFQDPLFTPVTGIVTVPLTLQLGLRSLEADAIAYVLTPATEKIHEYRREAPELTPTDFITNIQITRGLTYDISFTEPPRALTDYEVGEHILKLTLNGVPFEVTLVIRDTTAPTATPVALVEYIGEIFTPDAFVTDVFDASEIEYIVFAGDNAGQPTIAAYQDQVVEIEISDIYGNTETFGSSLTIRRNELPPAFNYVPAVIESIVGNPIAYPEDVVATDDFGRNIEYGIDDSHVDINVTGKHTITYIAEDFSGLKTEVEVTLFMINIDPEEVNIWVDAKLAEIINDTMTQEDKVRAIWNCVRSTISRGGSEITADPWTDSVYTAAHYAINNTVGAHYHFYALSEVMLTRAGFENMRIVRSDDVTPAHFWNLVLYDGGDDGGWYHYDSTPATDWTTMNSWQHRFTQEQAEEIARQMASHNSFHKNGYYDFNPDLYPDIVSGKDDEESVEP